MSEQTNNLNHPAPESGQDNEGSVLKEIRDYILMIAIVVAVVFVINQVFLINARIPSSSMEKIAGRCV